MEVRARRVPALAAGLLAAIVLAGPVAFAAEPSADDPVASMDGLLDALITKDYASMGPFLCAEKRGLLLEQLDLSSAYIAVGVDPTEFLGALMPTVTDRSVTLVSQDATSATVAVTGLLAWTIDDDHLRSFLHTVFKAQGLDDSDDIVEENMPIVRDQMRRGVDLTNPETTMVLRDGRWLVCDDVAGISTDEAPIAPDAPAGSPAASAAS